jgi:cytochrome P450
MLLLTITLLLIFIGLLTYYFLLIQQRYEYFSRRGIVTPPFQLFFGHLKTLWTVPSYHRQLESWTKQYGKIYGIYEGIVPTFVVSDPDFLQEAFVKQFTIFHARRATLVDILTPNLATSSGPKWRRHRHVLNPTFTAAKLKMMSPLINGCIDDLMKKLIDHTENGDEFNIYLYYQRMTMDAICKNSVTYILVEELLYTDF